MPALLSYRIRSLSKNLILKDWWKLPGPQVLQVLGLGLLWAALSWWVQDIATAPGLWKKYSMIVKDQVFRFLLNWSTAVLLLSLLKTRYVIVLLAISAFVDGAILSFYSIFQRSLSWLTISKQSGEGAAVAGVALELAAPYLGLIAAVSVLMVYLHQRWRRDWVQPQGGVVAAGSLVWLSCFLGLNLDHKPLERLATFESADGIAFSYGFLLTWMGESYYIDDSDMSADAIETLHRPAERLLERLPPQSLGDKLAVVQVESLDDALMEFSIQGQEVTPFLNQARKGGNYFRLQAPKRNGSCDSDFTLLFGGWPSQKTIPYRIKNFPFEKSIIRGLEQRGIFTSLYHGVNGTFFERRAAFSKMGFSAIKFREELIKDHDLVDPQWTLPDGLVFASLAQARQDKTAFFEFMITGTSHVPFYFSLQGHERRFFPKSNDQNEQYFDSMNYVDTSIRHYIEGLPEGTLVLIYGDHWSSVKNTELGYHSEVVDHFGLVPGLLFRWSKAGMKPILETDESWAESGRLRLVDVARWFRLSLELEAEPVEGAPPEGETTPRPRVNSGAPQVHAAQHEDAAGQLRP